MIRFFVILAVALLLFAGCSDSSLERQGGRTQEIVQESSSAAEVGSSAASSSRLEIPDYMGLESSAGSSSTAPVLSSSEVPASTEGTSSAVEQNITSSGTGDNALDLFTVRAEKEAIELDIQILESNFRVGKISQDEFYAEKARLEQQKNDYDNLEDTLEHTQVYHFTFPETTEAQFQRLNQLEADLDRLEEEMDQWEDDYVRGVCTREEFLEKRLQQEQQEDAMEEEEEQLEDYLERFD